jgi:exonuclease 3'-5' domain-containing protein 1
LKHAAFDTQFQGYSLRKLLESHSTRKVIFDVRNDSDALFSHFKVSLNGAVDLQMMEFFYEGRSGQALASLKHCIEQHAKLPTEILRHWSLVKGAMADSMRNIGPEDLPSQRRPLAADLIQYAVGDVEYLPLLYKKFSGRLTKEAWKAVKSETGQRLQESRKPDYDLQGKVFLGQPRGLGPLRKPYPQPRTTLHKQRGGGSTGFTQGHQVSLVAVWFSCSTEMRE